MAEKSERKDPNLKIGRINKTHNKIIYVLLIIYFTIPKKNRLDNMKIKNRVGIAQKNT